MYCEIPIMVLMLNQRAYAAFQEVADKYSLEGAQAIHYGW